MCDCPINIENPNYSKMPNQTKRILVPCGKCTECFKARAKSWFVRLHYENRVADSAHFVTLTYDVPRRTYNGLYTVHKPDLQNFMKRLRKREPGNNRIKYYAASEYGEKYHRPHYHILLFNVRDENNIIRAWSDFELDSQAGLSDALTGAVDIGNVESPSIMYVTGYIGKRIGIPLTDYDDREKEFSLMSKQIGVNFLEKAYKFNTTNEETFTNIEGLIYSLPRYYREKIWKPTIITPDEEYVKKHFRPELHPAMLKPIIKRHPELLKIIQKNVENQIQTQNRDINYFGSVGSWETHKYTLADIRNKVKPTFINSKIEN